MTRYGILDFSASSTVRTMRTKDSDTKNSWLPSDRFKATLPDKTLWKPRAVRDGDISQFYEPRSLLGLVSLWDWQHYCINFSTRASCEPSGSFTKHHSPNNLCFPQWFKWSSYHKFDLHFRLSLTSSPSAVSPPLPFMMLLSRGFFLSLTISRAPWSLP
jgi:hypothetical protein